MQGKRSYIRPKDARDLLFMSDHIRSLDGQELPKEKNFYASKDSQFLVYTDYLWKLLICHAYLYSLPNANTSEGICYLIFVIFDLHFNIETSWNKISSECGLRKFNLTTWKSTFIISIIQFLCLCQLNEKWKPFGYKKKTKIRYFKINLLFDD